MHHIVLAALVLVALVAHAPARADVAIHGFGDIVGSESTSDFAVNGIGNHGRALQFDPESRLGINLSSNLSDSLDFAAQLVARGADGGSYNVQADWLFLTYRPSDEFKVRVGRQISPAFLFSEQVDVGYTYLWTRLPFEVYGVLPVKSFTGAAVFYTRDVDGVNVTLEAHGGGTELVSSRNAPVTFAPGSISAFGTNVKGLAADALYGSLRVHLSYISSSHSQLYFVAGQPPIDLGLLDFYTAGARFDVGRWFLASEAIRALNVNAPFGSATGAYATAGYHATSRLTPYVSYNWQGARSGVLSWYPGATAGSASNYLTGATSWVGGVNYLAGLSAIIKAEYMNTASRFVTQSLNYRVSTYTGSVDFVF